MTIKLFVNDEEKTWDIAPDEFLAETLQKHGYASVKTGCGAGACGVCTVWVDGKPMLSCSALSARMNGRRVTTLEGVEDEARALAQKLLDEGVDQCGYCSPGFIMLVLAMSRELTDPTLEEMKEYLNGNLCRCSGYQGKYRAIERYLKGTEAPRP